MIKCQNYILENRNNLFNNNLYTDTIGGFFLRTLQQWLWFNPPKVQSHFLNIQSVQDTPNPTSCKEPPSLIPNPNPGQCCLTPSPEFLAPNPEYLTPNPEPRPEGHAPLTPDPEPRQTNIGSRMRGP